MLEFPRERYVDALLGKSGNGMAKVIVGLRRSGKSYLLFRLLPDALAEAFPGIRIVPFSFEDGKDLDRLDRFLPERPLFLGQGRSRKVDGKKFRAYLEDALRGEGRVALLLDEVQRLDSFADTLNGFLPRKDVDVYVTGSNARFLSSDIATEFRGRGDIVELRPLTFLEIKEATGLSFGECYALYSRYGGLPYVQSLPPGEKEEYLARLLQETYLRDLVDRHRIKDEEAPAILLRLLASSMGSYQNPFRLERAFRGNLSLGYAHERIARHIRYLKDAFLIEEAPRFDVKGNRIIAAGSKFYFEDLGLRNAVLSFQDGDEGRLMENAVYLELRARGYRVEVGNVPFERRGEEGRVEKGYYEIDFRAGKGSWRHYVQCSYYPGDRMGQEMRPLLLAPGGFGRTIISYGEQLPHYDRDGVLHLSLRSFLEDPESLE